MKKLIGILAVALLLAAPAAIAQMAGSVLSLNAATANLTGSDARFGAYPALQVHVFGASAVCTVAIEIGSTLNNYQVVAQVLNPSKGGEWWAGPSAPLARCRVMDGYVSGSASCIIIASSNVSLAKSWKRIDFADGVAPATATPTLTPTVTPTGTLTPTVTPTATPTPRT